jgi:hypothetical protein
VKAQASVHHRYNDWLQEVTYRPGWELVVRCDDYWPLLEVRALVEDTRRPGHQIVVTHRTDVYPDLPDRATFLRWLRDALVRVEIHESAEWLRWSGGPDAGKPIFDPHKET